MASYYLKIAYKTGPYTKARKGKEPISFSRPDETTVFQLTAVVKTKLEKFIGLQILHGDPPVALDLKNYGVLLHELNIKDGDTLYVEAEHEDCCSLRASPSKRARVESPDDMTESHYVINIMNPEVGVMLRHYLVPSNSCLFDSFHYILSTGHIDADKNLDFCTVLAEKVTRNPAKYHANYLGMPNCEYSQWILNPVHWGGLLELELLSEHYKIEIVAFDLGIPICHHFGNSSSFTRRGFMVFNGLLFNPVYYKYRDYVQTIFPVTDSAAMDMATEVARKAKSPRYVFQGYEHRNLKCQECQTMLIGDIHARVHTMATKHNKIEII